MIRRVLTVDYLLTQLKKPTILTPWGDSKLMKMTIIKVL